MTEHKLDNSADPAAQLPQEAAANAAGDGVSNETAGNLDPRQKLLDRLNDFEVAAANLHLESDDGGKRSLFAETNDLNDALRAQLEVTPQEEQEAFLLDLTDRLASVAANAGDERERDEVFHSVGTVVRSYDFLLNTDTIPRQSLLRLADLLVASGSSAQLPAIAESVYFRCHNDLFTDQRPEFASNPAFTRALFDRFLNRTTSEEPVSPDPNRLMLQGLDVARAAELHLMAMGFSGREATTVTSLWGTMKSIKEQDRQRLGDELLENMHTIEFLENEQPGFAARLLRERGVAHFGRYSLDLLLQQFDALPEGVEPDFMIMAHADHNAAFSGTVRNIEGSLNVQSSLEGGPDTVKNIRIAEVGTVEDLIRMSAELSAEFGPARNLIIGGHGDRESVTFGPHYVGRKSEQVMLILDQVKDQLDQLAACVLPGGSILLVSCSTGAQGGIGEAVAGFLERDTQAPVTPANVTRVSRTESGLLVAEFADNAGRTISTQGLDLAA